LGLSSPLENLLRSPFFCFAIRYQAATPYHYSAMAPRKRAIPAEEWERHREVIKGLFAQKPLIEVIEEMKQKYNFEAT
jgi:Clr5 domain